MQKIRIFGLLGRLTVVIIVVRLAYLYFQQTPEIPDIVFVDAVAAKSYIRAHEPNLTVARLEMLRRIKFSSTQLRGRSIQAVLGVIQQQIDRESDADRFQIVFEATQEERKHLNKVLDLKLDAVIQLTDTRDFSAKEIIDETLGAFGHYFLQESVNCTGEMLFSRTYYIPGFK